MCERLGVKLPGRLGEWVAVTGVGFSPTPRLRGAIPVPLCVLCLLRVYPGEDEAASHLTKAFLRFFSVPPRLRGNPRPAVRFASGGPRVHTVHRLEQPNRPTILRN